MNFSTSKLLACGSLVIVILNSSLSYAADAVAEAEELYKKGNYQEAYTRLEGALKTNAKDPTAHYLMGNVLLKLKRRDDAIKEYKLASVIDPAGNPGIYSKQALYFLLRPAQPAENGLPSSTSESAAKSAKPAQSANKEVAELTRVNDGEFNQRVAEIKKSSDEQISRLKREMQDRIDANGSTQYAPIANSRFPGRVMTVQTYNPEQDNLAIKTDYRARIEALEKDRDRKLEECTQAHDAKAKAIESSR